MARLLVTGDDRHIAARDLLARLVDAMRSAGHDATVATAATEAVDADGVVAVLDGAGARTASLVGFAYALDKPVLGLASSTPEDGLAQLCQVHEADTADGWLEALPAFYERVRPFAGRVVRDRIPQLVKEAGHAVAFREVDGDARPRFLKQKVAAEAQELLRADVGTEKEEIADVLEALEAFIHSRSFDRDDLKRIKEAKRKRRGGFDKVFVVESTDA